MKSILLLIFIGSILSATNSSTDSSTIEIDFKILKIGQLDSTEFSFTNHHTSSIKLINKSINSSFTIKYPKNSKLESGQTVKLKCYIKRHSVGEFIDSSKFISYVLGTSTKKVKLLVKALVPKKIESSFSYQNEFNIHDSIVFDSIQHDFGKVKEGDHQEHYYYFRNYSSKPILILSAPTNCGCLTSVFSKEPLMPGEISRIGLSFNTNGKIGYNNKTVTVKTNLGDIYIHLKCEVITNQ